MMLAGEQWKARRLSCLFLFFFLRFVRPECKARCVSSLTQKKASSAVRSYTTHVDIPYDDSDSMANENIDRQLEIRCIGKGCLASDCDVNFYYYS
jgi:hypothetical protein